MYCLGDSFFWGETFLLCGLWEGSWALHLQSWIHDIFVPTGKRAVKDSVNDGEANEYDLNDSFIDDEEEEECEPTDEDSDWEPSSEEKED